jgi:hypothetical protein
LIKSGKVSVFLISLLKSSYVTLVNEYVTLVNEKALLIASWNFGFTNKSKKS